MIVTLSIPQKSLEVKLRNLDISIKQYSIECRSSRIWRIFHYRSSLTFRQIHNCLLARGVKHLNVSSNCFISIHEANQQLDEISYYYWSQWLRDQRACRVCSVMMHCTFSLMARKNRSLVRQLYFRRPV